MSTTTVDGLILRDMLANGYRNLLRNADTVDDLNVFPVPDGDTGKNMSMTLEGGVKKGPAEESNVSVYMTEFARGTLLSARGNSGVILSQFIRGLSNGMDELAELSIDDFLNAMEAGYKKAYDSVAKPTEGTMLTVMRESTVAAMDNRDMFTDYISLFDYIIKEMRKSLVKTPDLLPVLKEAGVVDSGGAGLVYIFEGMLLFLQGEVIDSDRSDINSPTAGVSFNDYDPENLLTFGYCNEFILQLQKHKIDFEDFDLDGMIEYYESIGDSIVAVRDDSLVKVHVHSRTPEKVIEYARQFGELITVKIENMTVQHSELHSGNVQVQKEHVRYSVVATATGHGMRKYFKNAGASVVIDGGKTNNPSSEDFINAFRQVNADYILVLPNDSNIILAAEQAAKLYKDADVRVIPTKSLAEGYSALSMMDLSLDTVEDVISEMTYYLPNVTTGYVSVATRDANLNNVAITKGHYIGLLQDTVLSDNTDKVEAALELLDRLPDMEDKEVITAFCGEDVTLGEKSTFRRIVRERYPLIEVGMIDGGQDVYNFIFAIE